MKTFEERATAYMNCPWKNTTGCNLACATCFRSDSGWAKEMLDDFNRLGRRLEALERKENKDNERN